MNFDQWWATLTPAEQKTIGINNARFVWREACNVCALVADYYCEGPSRNYAELIADTIRTIGDPK